MSLWIVNQLQDSNNWLQLSHLLLNLFLKRQLEVWCCVRTASSDESAPVVGALDNSCGEWVRLSKGQDGRGVKERAGGVPPAQESSRTSSLLRF